MELVEADLLQEGAFDAAFCGCRYVFHTASPFFIEAGDPQAQLVEPAVRGTRNVMAAAARNKGDVQRVVLTSSCAGVRGVAVRAQAALGRAGVGGRGALASAIPVPTCMPPACRRSCHPT